jgi:hypothetical protein
LQDRQIPHRCLIFAWMLLLHMHGRYE